MREALLKVLASMDMEMPNKVLIAMALQDNREKIYKFLIWLKQEVPEEQVNKRQYEIANKAIKIAHGD